MNFGIGYLGTERRVIPYKIGQYLYRGISTWESKTRGVSLGK